MSGGFCVIQIEYGSYGEMLHRSMINRFASKQEAEKKAERVSKTAPHHGYNEEQGHWWSRDLSVGKAYRYIVAVG